MIRSCLLRAITFLAVLVPLLILLASAYQYIQREHVFAFVLTTLAKHDAVAAAPVPQRASSVGGMSIVGGPSVSASVVNQILAAAGSPAAGLGQSLYDLSVQYQVDDAYALAVFQHESSFGLAGAAVDNHSLGNIVCAGYPTCNGRFRWYASWQEGFEDFYRLIVREYVAHGLTTIETIVPVYAPSSENNPTAYIEALRQAVVRFRSVSLVAKSALIDNV